ncbi:MAG: hypothetical protein ACREKE_08900, partial [bacterium]
GWLEEIRSLASRYGDAVLQACAAIGYPELLEHIRGRLGLAQAKDLLLARTRRYARRQRTWFKAEFSRQSAVGARQALAAPGEGAVWASEPEALAEAARKFMGI